MPTLAFRVRPRARPVLYTLIGLVSGTGSWLLRLSLPRCSPSRRRPALLRRSCSCFICSPRKEHANVRRQRCTSYRRGCMGA
eukprot:COSAG01_NODE_717_length_14076_cov_20.354225_2_plen_82_part_00